MHCYRNSSKDSQKKMIINSQKMAQMSDSILTVLVVYLPYAKIIVFCVKKPYKFDHYCLKNTLFNLLNLTVSFFDPFRYSPYHFPGQEESTFLKGVRFLWILAKWKSRLVWEIFTNRV